MLLDENGGGDRLLTALDAAGDTPLHVAALGGHSRLVNRLLQECVSLVHVQDAQGWTALHYAASTGNVGIATMLVEAGATLVPDNDGEFGRQQMREFGTQVNLSLSTLVFQGILPSMGQALKGTARVALQYSSSQFPR